jgi:hypothetical protein
VRNRTYQAQHPALKNVEKCQEVIQKYAGRQKTERESFSSEKAFEGVSPHYMSTRIGGRFAAMHTIACTVQNGVRDIPLNFSDFTEMITASHLCQNGFCVNPKHLCFGRVLLNDKLTRLPVNLDQIA